MNAGSVRMLGKRALYGVVAGTCALIGIAALVLQFATRPSRAPLASARRRRRRPGDRAGRQRRDRRRRAEHAPAAASAVRAAPWSRRRHRADASSTDRAGHDRRATPRRVVPRAGDHARRATAVAPRPRWRAGVGGPPASPLERQARCTEILQKASLEKITPAETDFFKRECK